MNRIAKMRLEGLQYSIPKSKSSNKSYYANSQPQKKNNSISNKKKGEAK